jgi:hypothetical protein
MRSGQSDGKSGRSRSQRRRSKKLAALQHHEILVAGTKIEVAVRRTGLAQRSGYLEPPAPQAPQIARHNIENGASKVREIQVAERRSLSQNGTLLKGRQKLFLMYQFYRTNESLSHAHNIVDLTSLPWRADEKIETFRNDWESRLAGMASKIDEVNLEAILRENV